MTTINEEVIQLISDQQIRKSLNFKEKVKFNRTGNNHLFMIVVMCLRLNLITNLILICSKFF